MDPERWQRIEQLCYAALEREPSQQPAYLDEMCAGDEALRREVESLLDQQSSAEKFLEAPAMDLSAMDLARHGGLAEERGGEHFRHEHRRIGRTISHYRIVEKVASGGMGDVYRAVRADREYEKQVAIKLVRSGLDMEFILDRFRTERQLLAGLDHPNIARLLDAGTTDDGVPYYVMEFIEGKPIDEYCDAQRFSIVDRLRLFCAVCSAVHYAHQRLVVHRDIKPANILVTGDGVPKLLDFGIAKLLQPDSQLDEGARTVTMLRMMTPEYASPEQVRGEPITTATDVYSLGMVLYQLLSGQPAYRLTSHSPHEIWQAICETDPEKPSAAFRRLPEALRVEEKPEHAMRETISAARGTQPEKLHRQLSGDLDHIVLKAIRKEPQHRYASAQQLSEDIESYLQGRPVAARARTWRYRSTKFVRRNKAGVAAAVLVVLALAVGMITTIQERRRAEKRFNDVRELANSLIFEVHDSIRDLPGATAARKLILQRAQEYLDRLAADSKSDPELLRELATAYGRLGSVLGNPMDANVGNSEQALRDFLRDAKLREDVVAASPKSKVARRELAETYMSVSLAYSRTKEEAKAEDYLQRAFTIIAPLAASNPDDQSIQFDFGKVYERKGQNFSDLGRWDEAMGCYQKSLSIYQRLADADPKSDRDLSEVAFAHKHVGAILIMKKQLDRALAEYRAALPIEEAQLQADPQNLIKRYNITYTYSDIGFILADQGDFAGALDSYHRVLAIRRALADADPQDTRSRQGLANTYMYIALVLTKRGDFSGALENDKKADSIRQVLAQSDPANVRKRVDALLSQADVMRDSVDLAFQPKTPFQRRQRLCSQVKTEFQKAFPGLLQYKEFFVGNESGVLSNAQKAADRCNTVSPLRDRRD